MPAIFLLNPRGHYHFRLTMQRYENFMTPPNLEGSEFTLLSTQICKLHECEQITVSNSEIHSLTIGVFIFYYIYIIYNIYIIKIIIPVFFAKLKNCYLLSVRCSHAKHSEKVDFFIRYSCLLPLRWLSLFLKNVDRHKIFLSNPSLSEKEVLSL